MEAGEEVTGISRGGLAVSPEGAVMAREEVSDIFRGGCDGAGEEVSGISRGDQGCWGGGLGHLQCSRVPWINLEN